jgi:hypothetical protein
MDEMTIFNSVEGNLPDNLPPSRFPFMIACETVAGFAIETSLMAHG